MNNNQPNNDPHAITNPPDAKGLGSTDAGYIYPYQLGSGTMRGTQNVGGTGGVQIDSANNRITIKDRNGNILTLGVQSNGGFGLTVTDPKGNTITYGLQKDNSSGIEFADASGYVLRSITYNQDNLYDKTNKVNIMRTGVLPDSTTGFVVAKAGVDVSSLFS